MHHLDGLSYLYRGTKMLPAFSDADNQPTSGLHGLMFVLQSLRERVETQNITVWLPTDLTNARTLHPRYRLSKTLLEMIPQAAKAAHLLRAIGCPVVGYQGEWAEVVQRDVEALYVTQNPLLWQVEPKLQTIRLNSRSFKEWTREESPVLPVNIPTYLTLIGYSPLDWAGLKGFGTASARKLLNTEPCTLRDVLANPLIAQKATPTEDWIREATEIESLLRLQTPEPLSASRLLQSWRMTELAAQLQKPVAVSV